MAGEGEASSGGACPALARARQIVWLEWLVAEVPFPRVRGDRRTVLLCSVEPLTSCAAREAEGRLESPPGIVQITCSIVGDSRGIGGNLEMPGESGDSARGVSPFLDGEKVA